MKLRPVTKLDNRNTEISEKFDDDVVLANCNVIIFIPIYGQFPSIQKPDSGRMVYKTSLTIIFYLTETEKRTKKSPTQLSYYSFE